ncbi:MAG: phosphatase PAP2 family protein [Acutalibacteraceae bacterium]|nr:phosphatase PAP2 family protein [Acutalibacteraceae bacterium]
MEVLYFLEGIRNSVLDAIVSVVTLFGEETIFMAISMMIFWCVDKWQGYYLLLTGFAGTVINQTLKMTFKIPRPWIKDPNFKIVEAAREAATGYSFPSGHTQTSVGMFGGIARVNKNKALRIICIIMCVLVPFSRLYLGVHTPLDVAVSVGIALILIFAGYPLFSKAKEKPAVMYGILVVMTAMVTAALLYFLLGNHQNDENLASAIKNACTLLGCILGLIVVYTVDSKVTDFSTEAVWWVQIIKVLGGIVLVLCVKEGLRAPFELIFGNELVARGVRYFMIVIAGGIIWPLTFPYFSRLGNK